MKDPNSWQTLLKEVEQKKRSPLSAIAESLELFKVGRKKQRQKLMKKMMAVDQALQKVIDSDENLPD